MSEEGEIRPSHFPNDPMLTIKDVLQVIRDHDGAYTFSPDKKLPAGDFQLVVERVRGAYLGGYIESIKEHRSSRSGLVDWILAEGLTDDGQDYLDAAA